MSEGMKPCPFCGADAEAIMSELSDGRFAWRIQCEECEVCMPRHVQRAAAIAAWNRRAPTKETDHA